MNAEADRQRQGLGWLTLGALGVVFGDLGTSPLYALQEAFGGTYPIAPTRDGVITPSISVLSAIEGLEVATPVFKPFVVPLSVLILIALFSLQRFGTGRVGTYFGVILGTWFVTIAVLGAWNLAEHGLAVTSALDPRWAIRFFGEHGWRGVPVLGAVVLCLTGVEALYADMGHFGRRPIRIAWYALALPSLLLSYLGQGALLLERPSAASRPFFNSVPSWGLYPMVVLATAATVVASQALIAAAFSMTSQAAQLGYLPRVRVAYTSSRQIGQVYLPSLNWTLMIACVAVTLLFRSSAALAAAFGLAVSGTMTITTILFAVVARRRWHWSRAAVAAVAGALLAIDVAFLGANMLKVAAGGWLPLAIGMIVFILMATWTRGRALLRAQNEARAMSAEDFIASIASAPPPRVRGAAVFLHAAAGEVPVALLHNLKHNRILHETVVMLTIVTRRVPYVALSSRIEVAPLGKGFWRVVGNYGFMEQPNVPELLTLATPHGLTISPSETSFYLSRETVIPSAKPGMALWRERLFGVMLRNATPISAFFGLKPNRVVELGAQVEI